MVISIFRSRLRSDNAEEFDALAGKMMKLAEAMPGFLSYKVYVSDDGERCSIIEFDSHERTRLTDDRRSWGSAGSCPVRARRQSAGLGGP